jgi:hypothetical protein
LLKMHRTIVENVIHPSVPSGKMGRNKAGSTPEFIKHATTASQSRARLNATLVQRRRIGYRRHALKCRKGRRKKAPAAKAVSRRRPYGLYSVLELKPPATVKEANAAYKRLALQFHPDRARPNETAQAKAAKTVRMQLLNQAKEVLGDEKSKAAYDKTLCGDGDRPRRLPSASAVAAWRASQSINNRAEDAAVAVWRIRPPPPIKKLQQALGSAPREKPEFGFAVHYPERIDGRWCYRVGRWTRTLGRRRIAVIERSKATLAEFPRLRGVLAAVREEWLVGVAA